MNFRPAVDEQKRQVKWREITDALEVQDQKFEKLSEQLRRDLVVEQKHQIGLCANCRLPMYDNEERYTVNDSTYHRACFTCEVLSALNRNYHPACFTCTACGMCLDGVQFALDKNNQNTGETVRIVALDNNYHVDCYSCE
ncbi:LIM domain protein, partial [Ostertagia ostertagi]